MNIALLGPSGSGKGTHLSRIGRQFGLLPLNPGALLRENLRQKSPLGLLASKHMTEGELVPDELVDAMVESCLLAVEPGRGVVFDGFPRTLQQAEFLDGLLGGMKRTLDAVIYLRISPETALRRLTGRFLCQDCQAPYHAEFQPPARAGVCGHCGGRLQRRPDDIPEFARLRLRAFQRATGPLLEHYQTSNRLARVDAEAPAAKVWAQISEIIETIARGGALRSAAAQAAWLLAPEPRPTAPARPAGAAGGGFVLVGGPGSGKGTQAEELCRQRHLPHIATGDLFRDNLKRQTELGRLAGAYMERGELVPDDVTDAMVQERLGRDDTAAGFVLDGFPRTLLQAGALADILDHLGRQLAGVIYINVSDQEIVNRLAGRWVCRNCQTPYHQQFKPPARAGICDRCGGPLYQRDDDNPATIRARLKTFHAQTGPLLGYYQVSGLVAEVAGEGDVATVTARTLAAAEALATRPPAPPPPGSVGVMGRAPAQEVAATA
jgi:adenylate kinase